MKLHRIGINRTLLRKDTAMAELMIIASLATLSFAAGGTSIAQVDPYFSYFPTTLSHKASIDCTKAGSAVAKILCGGREGAMADWDMNSTLWAIAGTTSETQQNASDQDQDRWRTWLNNKCALPTLGDISQDQQRCVILEFHTRAARLRSKLTGDALAESRSSPEQHAQIQELLIARGLLQPPADGEFGSSTRQAIRTFQETAGALQTGFLSHEQSSRLQIAQQSPQSSLLALAQAPSFNCTKATYPDEYAICSNQELSQLDNVANAGYVFVRGILGHQYANSITLPLLRARHACAADLACIKERQLTAIGVFQALGAPISRPQNALPQGLLWSHNGSTVYLITEGHSRKFFYNEPRPGLVSAGAAPGSLIFEGTAIGDQYQGTAYLYNRHCGPLAYRVGGPILDNYRRVELHGKAPRIDENCRAVGYVDDLLEFQLVDKPVAQSTGGSKADDNVPQSSAPEKQPIDRERERSLADDQAIKTKLAELEETKLCQQLSGAKAYFTAVCVVRGMEQSRQQNGFQDAKTKAEHAQAGLDCTPSALGILQKLSERSAATILGSGAISKLMDFADAMTFECKKAANLNLK